MNYQVRLFSERSVQHGFHSHPFPRSHSGVTNGTSPHAYDVGLLIIRVALGLTVAAHGAQKLFGWFGGGGLKGTGQFFEMSGYPSGETMAAIAGLSEILGGLGLVLAC